METARDTLRTPTLSAQGNRGIDRISLLLFGCSFHKIPKLLPGVLLAGAIVMLSVVVADWVNSALGFKSLLGYITVAIMLGLVVGNVLPMPAIAAPGISFCLKKLLRVGIIIMGLRLSVLDAARIGAWGVPIVLICIITGLVLTTFLTRLLKLPERLGTLITIGTSICGTTAIVAAAPAIDADDEEVAYAVANITIFGIFAMLVYPYLANALFAGNAIMAGLFQGTSIHETAQVTGAALIYDQAFHVTTKPSAADVAIIMKLVRNVLMALVIPVMAFIYTRRTARANGNTMERINIISLFPVFILGFIAAAVLRSIGDAGVQNGGMALGLLSGTGWTQFLAGASDVATYALAMAMAGVGLGTRLSTLKGLGLKPFYLGLFSASVIGVVSMLAVWVFGPHVTF